MIKTLFNEDAYLTQNKYKKNNYKKKNTWTLQNNIIKWYQYMYIMKRHTRYSVKNTELVFRRLFIPS